MARQLIAESAVLAAAGGAAGLALAAVAVPLIAPLAPIPIPRLATARIDLVVVGAAVAMSAATALLFGLAPALRASRLDIRPVLHADARHTASGPTSWARQLLVGADVAFALVLLIAAGLMIRSIGRLLDIDPGFDPRGVLTMQLSMSGKAYASDAAVVAYGDRIIDRVRALPGVVDAALAGQVPLGGNIDRWGLHVDGRPPSADDPSAERYSVTPGYFALMRIPLRAGRLITDADRANTERVILVNERAARALWPDGGAIGHHVRIGGTDGPLYTIVGVVGDVHHVTLSAAPTFQIYTAQAQLTDSFLTLVIRSRGDLTALAAEARDAVWSVAHDVPVYAVAPLTTLVGNSVGSRRFVMVLLEGFGAVALLLTAVGIYGVVSYSVGERTREIGVRSALGASRRDIVRLVLGAGLRTIVVGLAVGVAVAAIATRFLQDSLFGVSPVDPLTYGAVTFILLASAILAQLLPVLRATRVDPAIALRQE
jgi:predicted permease